MTGPSTALVVLASADSGATSSRDWFSANGFDVGPLVGISFSISGPATVFEQTFGPAALGSAAEIDPAALRGRVDDAVLAGLAAIVIGPPPDFGPTSP